MPRSLGRAGLLARALILACSIAVLPTLPPLASASVRAHAAIGSASHATVAGTIRFGAQWFGWDVRRVQYMIDGHPKWTAARTPFLYGRYGTPNTRRLRNGRHLLKVVISYRGGRRRVIRRWIDVRNGTTAHTTAGHDLISALGSPLGHAAGASVVLFN